MATIEKDSLRKRIDALRAQFDQFRLNKDMPVHYLALFESLFVVIDIIVAAFMEKNTKKTSRNSGKPPSQTGKDESSLNNPGSKGKGTKENNTTTNNMRTEETITIAKVSVCDRCGEDLSDVTSHECERRTLIDLIFIKEVKHQDSQIKICPNCDKKVTAPFPKEFSGPLQYGHGIKAYIISLICAQMVSLNRTQKHIRAMIGKTIAEATLLKFVWRLYEALANWESEAKKYLLQAQALNIDETSFRVDKKNHWIHVYSSGDITLKCLHRKRGTEAMNDIGILPKYGGVAIHDGLAAYFTYKECEHALCGSHLLRDLEFVIESNGYAWAKNMKRLLKESCQLVSKRKRKKLTEQECKNMLKRYRNILTRGEKEMPAILTKPDGRRGRIAKSEAHNLLERLRKYEDAVLLFTRKSSVSFTNNRAERDLRMSKVKQKISGCFRTEKYAKAYCRISSYLKTMANKGYNPLVAIQMALEGRATELMP